MKIGIIARWVNPNLEQTIQILLERGVDVEVIYPDQQTASLDCWSVEHDLYLLKSGTEAALSMAGALHFGGAEILNPYPVAAMLRNKLIVTSALQQAGIPTPQTYVTHDSMELAGLLDESPLIVKPFKGSGGKGVKVIETEAQLRSIDGHPPIMVQKYNRPDAGELDRKIYRIGDQIFGVKRVWPLRSYQDKYGEPFEVTGELKDLALKCGEVFGLELYGLDVVISGGQPWVVDINKFGSFIGVPNGPALLADHFMAVANRARKSTPVSVG